MASLIRCSILLRPKPLFPHFSCSRYATNSHQIVKKESKPHSAKAIEGGPIKKRWNYVVTVIKTFVKGMKSLIADVKEVRRLRQKMGGLKIDGNQPLLGSDNEITWENLRFIKKTVQDLKRTFPAIALFWIPLVGYVAPFLALAFPGYLLSSHFWSDEQRADFEKDIREARTRNTKHLREHLNQSDLELNRLISDCLVEVEKCIQEQDWDQITESGVLSMSLSQLPRQHLVILSSSWGVKSLLPSSWWLRRKLTKHFDYIYCCDYLLLSQGVMDTTKQRELLIERNISIINPLNDSELDSTLKEWISITASNKSCPYVLMGHAPLLWTK